MLELTGTRLLVPSPVPSGSEAARGGPGTSPPNARALPPFVSSAPPRSEGEALLRRIFSRGARM